MAHTLPGRPTEGSCERSAWLCVRAGVVVLAVALVALAGDGSAPAARDIHYYSTAAPPVDYPGPEPAPMELALATNPPPNERSENTNPPAPEGLPSQPNASTDRLASAPAAANESPAPSALPPLEAPHSLATPAPRAVELPREEVPHLANASLENGARPRPRPNAPANAESIAPPAHEGTTPAPEDPITVAKRTISECKARYTKVQDYTCTFVKRERIDGQLMPYNIMSMKVRARPLSVYFKFQQPYTGREAIYVAGKNRGHVLAHDVGIGKLVAGTLDLDPRGSRAMEECLHPITEAGIGHLIDTVYERWMAEMSPAGSQVTLYPSAHVGQRDCLMIDSTHPKREKRFMFYKVKLYVDKELGLPIRYEAYDWPRRPGDQGELVEEYTYMNLRLNVGLREYDFDTANKGYSFGRF